MLYKAYETFNFLQYNFQPSAFSLCLQTSVQRTCGPERERPRIHVRPYIQCKYQNLN